MAIYRVNADFAINVTTFVDGDDVRRRKYETLDDAVRRVAQEQITSGAYEVGDPVSEPDINWVEVEDDDDMGF